MTQTTQYAIYVTEQLMSNGAADGVDEKWHHTALWLVEEANDNAEVLQQLHFNNYSDDFWEAELGTSKMVPNVRFGLCKSQAEAPEKIQMTAVKRGGEGEILANWNHMLAFSAELRDKAVPFDLQDSHLLHSNNCRSGVIAAARTIGVEYDKRLYLSESGTQAGRIQPGEVLDPQEAAQQDVELAHRINEALTKRLAPPWEMKKLEQSTALSTRTLINHI